MTNFVFFSHFSENTGNFWHPVLYNDQFPKTFVGYLSKLPAKSYEWQKPIQLSYIQISMPLTNWRLFLGK